MKVTLNGLLFAEDTVSAVFVIQNAGNDDQEVEINMRLFKGDPPQRKHEAELVKEAFRGMIGWGEAVTMAAREAEGERLQAVGPIGL